MRNYWVGTFYPIFKISFYPNNEIKDIKTELSLNGKLWSVILGILISSIFLFEMIIPMIEDYKYLVLSDFMVLVVYGFLAFGLYWVLNNIYKNERQYLLNDLKIAIGIETNENIERIENEKKEWTLKKTITRLFLYPFSLFILILSIITLLQGNLKGLFGTAICTAYLYADIKILLEKRKNN